MNRRGFIGALAIAPVAAREAAAKAGVSALASAGNSPYGGGFDQTMPAEFKPNSEYIFCRLRDMQRWLSPSRLMMQQRKAPCVLDPDLASSRSLSLSAAMHIQRKRNVDRIIDEELSDLQQHANLLGIDVRAEFMKFWNAP